MKKYVAIVYISMLILLVIQPVDIYWKGLYYAISALFGYFYWKHAWGRVEYVVHAYIIFFHASILLTLALGVPPIAILFVLLSFLVFEAKQWDAVKREKTSQNALAAVKDEMNQMNDLFRSIRSQRHDAMKHLNTIHFLLENDRVQEAKEYLDEYIGQIKDINSPIKGEEGHVASALFHLIQRAKKNQISVSLQCQAALSSLPMNRVDQISVLMNLLENSIDAAKESIEKKIMIKTSIHSGIYILEVINSTMAMSKQDLFSQFEQTTKGENHQGLGTWIINQIVNANDGVIDYHYVKPYITIKIKLPIVVREKERLAY